MDTLQFVINGQKVIERGVSPTTTLLQYLRQNMHLTGSKEGCAEGDCGACTVVILSSDSSGEPTFRAINSCLVLLPMIQGKEVVTVEGLREGDSFHSVQESLVRALGSQCGYCTPGVVMSMFEAHYRKDLDADWKIDDQMCGNLCRCTGYRPIMDATKEIAGKCPSDRFSKALESASPKSMELSYEHEGQRYFNPVSFRELWDLMEKYPDARLVCGGTDLSLEITKQFKTFPLLISLEGIEGLTYFETSPEYVTIGASFALSNLEAVIGEFFPSIERMLRFFGARQIKNRGTVGGNLCTASPIGDMAPVLLSLQAIANIRFASGIRQIHLSDFFTGYRQTALEEGEILDSIQIPRFAKEERILCSAYKVSKRQELDISTVSAGFWVHLNAEGIVQKACLGFGGMAATPARAKQTEDFLQGKQWEQTTVQAAAQMLKQDFTPIDDPRASAWYRQKVAANLLQGFYLETEKEEQPRLPYRPTGTVHLEEGS